MCITPNHIWVQRGPKWEQQPAACRQCWRCKQNRVNDYVARALAEASVSIASCTLNLTYATRDDLADKVLHPRHFQLFMKLLRRAGHKVRYLVAGEYGEKKGRAHFHVLLFFSDIVSRGQSAFYNPDHIADPDSSAPFSREIPQERMVHIREWPHGHITCDWSASEKSARYVCKYLLKKADQKHNSWFSLSKKPALGADWFARKAEMHSDLGALPHSFEYLPPGGTRGRKYLMTGATRRDFLNAVTIDHRRRESMSEWVQKSFDKYDRQRIHDAFEAASLAAALNGSVFLNPVDDPEPVESYFDADYVRWWLHHRPTVDHPFDWQYLHSEWKPPIRRINHGAFDKKGRLSFRPSGCDFADE